MTTIRIIYDKELVNQFNDYLDDTYGTYTIASMDYLASEILKQNDPVAYRVIFNEWLDNQVVEGIFKEDNLGNYYVEEE